MLTAGIYQVQAASPQPGQGFSEGDETLNKIIPAIRLCGSPASAFNCLSTRLSFCGLFVNPALGVSAVAFSFFSVIDRIIFQAAARASFGRCSDSIVAPGDAYW